MADSCGSFVETSCVEDADIVILNTCHIREKAAEKIFSELGLFREPKEAAAAEGLRRPYRGRGCVAQAEGAEFCAAQPRSISWSARRTIIVCPTCRARPRRPRGDRIPDRGQIRRSCGAQPAATRRAAHRLSHRAGRLRQVLHFLRRALYARHRNSRPVEAIVAEAERLADAGVREVTLIGQNVNAYHGEGAGRATVVAGGACSTRLADISGLERLRYRPAIRATWRRSDRRASRLSSS